MTSLIGHTSILLALLLALLGVIIPIIGSRSDDDRYFAFTRLAILGQFILVTLAASALIYGLVTTDFSIKYVAFNTTRATPVYYRITGLWGALEGSLLLWEWLLIIFSWIVAWIYRDRHRELMPWVLMIFSIVSAFFLGVVSFVSNPFETIFPVPVDGRGLNPLLEDANMMTHPPLLYTGFVGLTVPYAFAMAALIKGTADINLPQPAVLQTLDQAKRDLLGALKPIIEGFIQADPPLDAGMAWELSRRDPTLLIGAAPLARSAPDGCAA